MTRALVPGWMKHQRKRMASVTVEIPICRPLRTMILTGRPALYWRSTSSTNYLCAQAKGAWRSNLNRWTVLSLMVSSSSKGHRSRLGIDGLGVDTEHHPGEVPRLAFPRCPGTGRAVDDDGLLVGLDVGRVGHVHERILANISMIWSAVSLS